jgi:hypothetical protein
MSLVSVVDKIREKVGGLIYNYILKHQFPKIEDFEPKSNLCYLAIITGSSISISSTYIVFVTKLQKRQTLEKGSALFKNDITTN